MQLSCNEACSVGTIGIFRKSWTTEDTESTELSRLGINCDEMKSC